LQENLTAFRSLQREKSFNSPTVFNLLRKYLVAQRLHKIRRNKTIIMKKILFLLAVATLIATGCRSTDNNNMNTTSQNQPSAPMNNNPGTNPNAQ